MTALVEITALSIVFATSFLITYFALLLTTKNSRNNGVKYPPCLPVLPIVGSLPFVRGGMDVLPRKFMELSKKLGPVFSFYSGSRRVVVLNGKSIVDALLKKSQIFADRPEFWVESNILNTKRRGLIFVHYNDAWKKNNKMFLSTMREFGFGTIKDLNISVWNEVELLIDNIRQHNGKPFDPKTMILHSTANVMMTFLFGQDFQKQEYQVQEMVKNAHKWVENFDQIIDVLPLLRFAPYYAKKIVAIREAQDMLNAIFEKAIEHHQTENSSDNTFTARYLKNMGQENNRQDLSFVLRDLCLGSSDTMVKSLLWLLLEMANNPLIQARVQKEIDENVPEERFPSYDDRIKLPYTEATTLEAQRFHTILPFSVLRQTVTETEIGGYFIPKCMIIPNLYSIHMDPEIWTDPENFRPERLLNEDNKVIGKEKIIPFGVGKRSCCGEFIARQEVFQFFAALLQHFEVRPPVENDVISVTAESGLTVGPSTFEIRFVPRKKSGIQVGEVGKTWEE